DEESENKEEEKTKEKQKQLESRKEHNLRNKTKLFAQEEYPIEFENNPQISKKISKSSYCWSNVTISESILKLGQSTKKLMEKLGLEIDRPSKTVMITANRSCTKALGIITSTKIILQNLIIPIDLQVIDSKKETLLLETD
ncbi:42969_t:CDS:2, partial [Gigaspora margarita]